MDHLQGKYVSILGDSISTFLGISTGKVFYSEGTLGVSLKDTWWMQVIDTLGLKLLVNNSSSGSCVFGNCDNESGYPNRCVELDKNNIDPDVIFVFMGTNDFTNRAGKTMGTAASVDEGSLIIYESNNYTYGTPNTVCEAYWLMLHKITHKYPNAQIFCMTLPLRRDPVYSDRNKTNCGQPTTFNKELKSIIQKFGAIAIDLEHCYGDTTDTEMYDQLIPDKWLHPGPLGMDRISNAVLKVIKNVYATQPKGCRKRALEADMNRYRIPGEKVGQEFSDGKELQ